MALTREQKENWTLRKGRRPSGRWLKKQMAKARRLDWKRKGQDAPKKREYRGYEY